MLSISKCSLIICGGLFPNLTNGYIIIEIKPWYGDLTGIRECFYLMTFMQEMLHLILWREKGKTLIWCLPVHPLVKHNLDLFSTSMEYLLRAKIGKLDVITREFHPIISCLNANDEEVRLKDRNLTLCQNQCTKALSVLSQFYVK